MSVYLRNVRTHEVKVVEPESDEYFDLIDEVYDPGDGTSKPAWEQQGHHSTQNEVELPDSGATHEGIAPEGPEREPHKNLTPGEVESGLKDFSQKEKELKEQAKEFSGEAEKGGTKGTTRRVTTTPRPHRRDDEGGSGRRSRRSTSGSSSSGSGSSGSGSSGSSGSSSSGSNS